MKSWHLAEINVATLKAPIDAPETAEFVANLDRINALAEAQDGFVWRLKGEGNDATDLKAFDNPLTILNMSVWRDAHALVSYVYHTAHREIMRRRAEWMEPAEVSFALWWVPEGHEPTPTEGIHALETLRRLGPTPAAFTLKDFFVEPKPIERIEPFQFYRAIPSNKQEAARILDFFSPNLNEISHQPDVRIGEEDDPTYVLYLDHLDRGLHIYLLDYDEYDHWGYARADENGSIHVKTPGGATFDPLLWDLYYNWIYLQKDMREIEGVILRVNQELNAWDGG
jgi:hypothetical protein